MIWVQPGTGSHQIDGGSGDDAIYGNAGADRLDGGIGNDFLSGAEGNDILNGAGGDDVILGGEGDDELDGGGGTDVLMGGAGNDVLIGAGDADVLLGDDGDDTLDGGANADQLLGGAGNDELTGGADNDIIGGGEGNDRLEGDSGADQFVIAEAGPADVDTISDYRFGQDDFIDLSGLLDANFELTSSVADFVRVVQIGRSVSLQVDVDGTAGVTSWTEVAILENYDMSDQVDVFFAGRHFILPASVVTGDVTGAAVEAGGVANADPGTPVATGDLFADDVDGPDDSWQAVFTPTPSGNGYGTFVMTAAGVWTYTLDNRHPDIQALNAGGATLTDSFTVLTEHGTPQTVTVNITGANDAPVAVADDNNGDLVQRTVGGPGDLLATGNVLLNDIDVDAGDTMTVTEVDGSAANVGQALVGSYGTMTLTADGVWAYTLNEADPDTLALAPNQTAVDTFSYTMSDANGATSSTTLNITVTGGDDPPYINTTSLHPFTTPQAGDLIFINGFSFQDIDSVGDVTVTIASDNPANILQASSGGGVTVGGGGTSSITLTGAIAAINAFVSGNNILWPSDDFVHSFTLTIDDNGPLAGGMEASTSVLFVRVPPNFSGFGDNPSLAGWNLNETNINLGGGNNSVVTAWSHGPDPTDIQYDGGSGFDTITLAFSPQQLEAILSNATDRGVLQNYLDGDVAGPFGDNTLSLGATSWNATATNFEDVSLALATGASGFVKFSSIGEDLPDFDATPDISDDTTIGTAGDDTISGLAGNDILVGGAGNDNLSGDAGADMLLGGSGNDTLQGAANDILAGGTGADMFIFTETAPANSASIVDYSFVDGDTIDLSALLDAGFVTGQPVSSFVRALQTGSSITLQVDIDGGGDGFVDVATLTGYGTNSADLLRVRFEGADHTLLV